MACKECGVKDCLFCPAFTKGLCCECIDPLENSAEHGCQGCKDRIENR